MYDLSLPWQILTIICAILALLLLKSAMGVEAAISEAKKHKRLRSALVWAHKVQKAHEAPKVQKAHKVQKVTGDKIAARKRFNNSALLCSMLLRLLLCSMLLCSMLQLLLLLRA